MRRLRDAFRLAGIKCWLFCLSGGLGALSASALAADWSLTAGTSQSLTFDDNLDDEEHNRDAGLISSTSFNFVMLGLAKTYKIELAPAVSLQKTFFSQDSDNWSYYPSGTLALSKWTKLTTYDLVTSFSRAEASSNDLVENDTSTNEGDVLTYSATGTITRKVNNRNSLIWSNSADVVDYTQPSDDLVPSLTVNSSGTWQRELSELVSGNLLVSAQYYDPDSSKEDKYLLYRSTAGVDAQLSKRLSVSGALGVVLQDTEHEKLNPGGIFNVSADYQLKDTSYTISAGYDIVPDQDGDLEDRYTTQFGVSHQVNDMTTVGVTGGYSFETGSEKSNALTISPSLRYQLSRDWNSTLAYRFIQEDDDGEQSHSNAVILSVSYGTTLLP